MATRTQLGLDFSAPTAPRTGRLRHHHVRAHQPVDEALAGEHQAKRQEAALLSWWRDVDAREPGARRTPREVHAALGGDAFGLLTSVRRAITNLTTAELLQHHAGDRRRGPFGKTEGTWSLAPEVRP